MLAYHGTCIGNIKELIPFSKSHNTIKKSVIYLTPNATFALFYIWNRSYKWVSFVVDDNDIVVFTEHYKNHLKEFYENISGYIYTCDGNHPFIYKTHIKSVYNSEIPVPIIGCQEIPDVYYEIREREKTGKVRIKTYELLTNNEKDEIFSNTVRAIHMEKLLGASDYNLGDKIDFIKQKFPEAWYTAIHNTKDEIENMINEWKNSI